MRTYNKYKDSGIEWIGEIPEHWIPKKLKYFAKICNGKDYKEIQVEEGGFPVYGTGGVFNYASKCLYNKPSVLLGRKGTVDRPIFVTEPFWTSDTIYYTEIQNDVSPKFFFYLSRIIPFDLYTYGSAVPSMTKEHYDNMIFGYAPISEQIAIANYLNSKTTEIDQTIADKEALVNLYEEEKKALINEAVTKGLNPDVKLKPSGVDWLGEVPEHWEVKRLKYLTEVISKGTTPSTFGGEIIDDANIIFIKAENIKNNELDFSSTYFIDEETNKLIARSTLQENDILFVIAGATIGKVAILSKQYVPANTNQAISFIRLNKNENHRFIWYWLQSIKINEQLWLDAVQSAQPNLSMENLGNFYVPYPQKQEQIAIVHYIESEIGNINDKIGTVKQEIELLKEYRQALIFEAVTGKIKVV